MPNGTILRSYSPATGEVVGSLPLTEIPAIPGMLAKAGAAQRVWEKRALAERLRFLPRLRAELLTRKEEIARLVSWETGKPYPESLTVELIPALDMIRFLEKEAERILRPERLGLGWFVHKRSILEHIPLGVVGIISPWNYPFGIPFTQVTAALIAGNAVLLKPSELTPLSGRRLVEVFGEAGLEPDLLQLITGEGSRGEALVSAGPDKIVFTGSVATGKKVMGAAAQALIPLTLELGGKDPMLVLKDANLERAANGAVWGAFTNAGQVCASVERCYVERAVAEEFIAKVVAKAGRLRQGSPLERAPGGEVVAKPVDIGPLINETQRRKVQAQVEEALALGGKVLCGGEPRSDLPGYFYPPTVLVNVPPGAAVWREETFGPLLPIAVVDSAEEGIALANDSRYALSASVWSQNRRQARAVAGRLEAGTVWINDLIYTYGLAATPWGGYKESGLGRTHAAEGLRDFTQTRHRNEGYYPLKSELQWYPYTEKKRIWLERLIRFLYGR
ncbi:aldehyde dehydrogenase [NAD(P)+] [Acididesulfobacillus acetoxydans]|uniref:Aldehyde dehydrogenase n=1 Tax=Acididesulfobacillus acetoxydans TaxID=1561005 RepID=A0A8S0Y1J6_9FIRM|nr:aldehyde dehydrogenase family protein [Acididesulfobacillus acetoxydans]CAA7599525.1 aldehyde dehydrogenase [NAD(P)+] [Acididesulfobacillus acetoxydans]CEJ08694.1 Aldehyde dehydrogenase 22A1 [Acididesulfobacillus acetoxydans]